MIQLTLDDGRLNQQLTAKIDQFLNHHHVKEALESVVFKITGQKISHSQIKSIPVVFVNVGENIRGWAGINKVYINATHFLPHEKRPEAILVMDVCTVIGHELAHTNPAV